jgi:ABC-type antimicrobial peptide transport system permease subunit
MRGRCSRLVPRPTANVTRVLNGFECFVVTRPPPLPWPRPAVRTTAGVFPLPSNGRVELRIVGVVDDVREENVEDGAGWQVYYPATQESPVGSQLVVRSRLPLDSIGSSVVRTLRELNRRQPAVQLTPLRTLVSHAVSPRRFFMTLVAAMAGLGLLLAALGIHGVISYAVARQAREIGVRMALGASAGRVRRDVILSTLRLTLWGLGAGVVLSLIAARLIASLLYGTSPWDAATYAAMAAIFLAVALVSGYLPARTASRVNAMIALRGS